MSKNVGRLAYIFGNNNYHEFLPLKGAINDANLVEETLNKCGFDTYKYIDLNCDVFNNKIYEFKHHCMDYKVGLFYYAGHGFEYEGYNYLCPIDAEMDQIKTTNINITNLVNEISKDREFVCIVILDCCRSILLNNPRGKSLLNPIIAAFKNMGGTFIAYSTSSGEIAIESGGHGLYTKLLCKHILNNKQIEQIFKDVRKEMINDQCNNNKIKQISWEYSSLVEEFYFEQNALDKGDKSIVNSIIKNSYSYGELVDFIEKYCLEKGIKDRDGFLSDILNEIDKYSDEENTNV